ncbi:MAG: hypothetical protein ACRDPK_02505 [Carbonactinosporaceae bacterium]
MGDAVAHRRLLGAGHGAVVGRRAVHRSGSAGLWATPPRMRTLVRRARVKVTKVAEYPSFEAMLDVETIHLNLLPE